MNRHRLRAWSAAQLRTDLLKREELKPMHQKERRLSGVFEIRRRVGEPMRRDLWRCLGGRRSRNHYKS
jgi:hypothetical protein